MAQPNRSTQPTLTLGLPNFGGYVQGEWSRLLDLARAAEGAGFDRVVVNDHVVMGSHTEAYTWGRFPVPPEAPWLEPLTTLTAMAGATNTVRLATGVLIAPLRSAPLLAKTAATVDVLSGGRLDLGVGVGWQKEEYEASGLDFATRGQLLDDTLAACRALWSELPASFTGATTQFTEIFCAPQPAQSRLPVWIGGTLNARNLRRITEWGDGWIVIMGANIASIAEATAAIRAATTREIEVQAPLMLLRDDNGAVELARSADGVAPLIDAGVSDIYLNVQALARTWQDAAAAMARAVTQLRTVS